MRSAPNNDQWNGAKVQLLKKLWNEMGLSGTQIAELLGTTRNAVVGKVFRLGLSKRNSVLSKRAPKAEPKRLRSNYYPHALEPGIKDLLPHDCDPPAEDRVKFADLAEHHCRWSIGDPQNEDFSYCGRLKAQHSSYCEGHKAVAVDGTCQLPLRVIRTAWVKSPHGDAFLAQRRPARFSNG